MLILAAGDFHGNLGPLRQIVARHSPDLLLSPGDWGDPGQVDESALHDLLDAVRVVTVFGNHDDRALLDRLRNRDDSPVLLQPGEARTAAGLVVAGISGIWAKTRLGSRLNARWESARRHQPGLTLEAFMEGKPFPPYVTDAEVDSISRELSGAGVEILITHGCPVGVADLTPAGGRGGQACFRRATAAVHPRIHLCGHLHRLQRADAAGGIVLNCGDGAAGQGWLLRRSGQEWEVTAAGEV